MSEQQELTINQILNQLISGAELELPFESGQSYSRFRNSLAKARYRENAKLIQLDASLELGNLIYVSYGQAATGELLYRISMAEGEKKKYKVRKVEDSDG